MNAVERLWRALAAGDWASARSQFRPNATVEWPHAGARVDAEEYLARTRARRGDGIDVGRVVTEGRYVAVEARAGTARCAGFYDLHDGLIASATEYWVGEAA
jgi:ketosteroid isomerase-like protein